MGATTPPPVPLALPELGVTGLVAVVPPAGVAAVVVAPVAGVLVAGVVVTGVVVTGVVAVSLVPEITPVEALAPIVADEESAEETGELSRALLLRTGVRDAGVEGTSSVIVVPPQAASATAAPVEPRRASGRRQRRIDLTRRAGPCGARRSGSR